MVRVSALSGKLLYWTSLRLRGSDFVRRCARGSRQRAWVIQNKQRLLAVAFSLPAMILAGAWIGWMVDQYFEVSPWGVLAGTITGTVAGLIDLVRALDGSDA
ncbi:MAG: hypothetical protein D6761_05085 [Candidatus Dadabacteria bacterium]|nr:MAG: hypothetical protein D6761_05085 [Candidatus Dadabacteria bacterium]